MTTKIGPLRAALAEAESLLIDYGLNGTIDADELARALERIGPLTKRRQGMHQTRLRGDDNPRSKLTSEKAREIRQLYATWKQAGARKGYAELGDMFGVDWSTVRDVVKRRTWGHIE